MTQTLNIVVCNDERLFAEVLGSVLEKRGHHVMGYLAEPREALELSEPGAVDLVIVDVGCSGDDADGGAAAADAVMFLSRVTGADVIAVDESGGAVADRVLAAGARVCVDAAGGLDTVLQAVERPTVNGSIDAARSAERGAASWSAASLARFLTPRERQALDALVDGDSTVALAARLGVGVATARTHVQNLLSKLGVHSRLEAVHWAVQHGLVKVPHAAAQQQEIA